MKFAVLFAFCCICTFFCCSCTTYATGNDGNTYEALSSSQIEHLIEVSRTSLKKQLDKGAITRQEYFDATHNEPTVQIEYRGDRYGTATIFWRTRGRRLQFQYDEDLTADIIPKCSFAVSIIPSQERRIQPDKSIRTGR